MEQDVSEQSVLLGGKVAAGFFLEHANEGDRLTGHGKAFLHTPGLEVRCLAKVHQRRMAKRQYEGRKVDARERVLIGLSALVAHDRSSTLRSTLTPTEGGLRRPDGLPLLPHVGKLRDVLLDVLVVEHALAHVALAHADIPIPAVDRLIATGHRSISVSMSAPPFASGERTVN